MKRVGFMLSLLALVLTGCEKAQDLDELFDFKKEKRDVTDPMPSEPISNTADSVDKAVKGIHSKSGTYYPIYEPFIWDSTLNWSHKNSEFYPEAN